MFMSLKATSGEKGPFRELARGPLARGDPLSITLVDDGVPFARITCRIFPARPATAFADGRLGLR